MQIRDFYPPLPEHLVAFSSPVTRCVYFHHVMQLCGRIKTRNLVAYAEFRRDHMHASAATPSWEGCSKVRLV